MSCGHQEDFLVATEAVGSGVLADYPSGDAEAADGQGYRGEQRQVLGLDSQPLAGGYLFRGYRQDLFRHRVGRLGVQANRVLAGDHPRLAGALLLGLGHDLVFPADGGVNGDLEGRPPLADGVGGGNGHGVCAVGDADHVLGGEVRADDGDRAAALAGLGIQG